MQRRLSGLALMAVVLSLGPIGCVAWPAVWVEETADFSVPAADVTELNIRTHNGRVEVNGEADREEIVVEVTKKAGGLTVTSAQACLDAIEIVSDSGSAGRHRLGWRWQGIRAPDWRARVSFSINAPTRLAVDVETHNGGIVVEGIDGECDLDTHNGSVSAVCGAEPLRAHTHNGSIHATTAAEEIVLTSHNGRIEVDAAQSKLLGGRVVTHNGRIRLRVNEETGADISCITHNGRITSEVPLRVTLMRRGRARGTLGDGGPDLHIETHNGSIRILE